jgi:hypothetical protein
MKASGALGLAVLPDMEGVSNDEVITLRKRGEVLYIYSVNPAKGCNIAVGTGDRDGRAS